MKIDDFGKLFGKDESALKASFAMGTLSGGLILAGIVLTLATTWLDRFGKSTTTIVGLLILTAGIALCFLSFFALEAREKTEEG